MNINMKAARLLNRKISRILATADSKRRKEIANTPIKWWQRIFTNRETIAEHAGCTAQYDEIAHRAYQWMSLYPTLNCGATDDVRVGYSEYMLFVRLQNFAQKHEID